MSRSAGVALRVNPDLPPKTHVKTDTSVKGTKFGLDIDTVLDVARALVNHPHLRVVGLVSRRQHKSRLRIIELGGDRLHLFGRQSAGIEHDGQRITAEGAVGENVHSDITPLHFDTPLSQLPHGHRPLVTPDLDLAERDGIAAGFAERIANRFRDQELRIEVLVERFEP